MALSNMLNEPRREVTETLLGAITVATVGAPSAWLAWKAYQYLNDPWNWLTGEKAKDGTPIYDASPFNLNPPGLHWRVLVVALLFAIVATAVGWGVLIFIHDRGDAFCDRLAEIGIDPRPKTRYGRNRR